MEFESDLQEAINALAWRDGVLWAIGDPDILRAFRDATGIEFTEPRSMMAMLVDNATGKRNADLEAFVDWFNVEVWDSDWVPDLSEKVDSQDEKEG